MIEFNNNDIDEKVLSIIQYRILVIEGKNLKSKELSDAKMAEKIMGIIKEELQCISNK
jgi:hypothetical protein